jgi:hypothetical protein
VDHPRLETVERSAAMDRFDPQQLVGARLVGPGEKRIGKIGQVLLDDRTGAAQWLTVRTGLFRGRASLVPLSGARLANNGDIQVPYSKDQVKDAPSVPVDGGHLSEADEASLYRYYGLEQAGLSREAGQPSGGPRHLARTERKRISDSDRHGPRRLRADLRGREERGREEDQTTTDDLRGRQG